jgi:hypothetical protein
MHDYRGILKKNPMTDGTMILREAYSERQNGWRFCQGVRLEIALDGDAH